MSHPLVTSKNPKARGFRCLFYVTGLLVLSLGITLTTKAGLGVSPLTSIPYSLYAIWGVNFGNATMASYMVYLFVEWLLRVLRHKGIAGPVAPPNEKLSFALLMDALQIPISLIFTRFLNVFNDYLPDLAGNHSGGFWGTFASKVLCLFFGIVLTGIGAALSMNMRLIPNPGDGVVLALADFTRKGPGLIKNYVDGLCALITIVISLVAVGHLVGVGLGTILSVLGVGRVIALCNRLFLKKITSLAGLASPSTYV